VTRTREPLAVRVDDDVVWAMLNRPRTRNAIDLESISALEAMLDTARKQAVKVLVLRGAGGTFCSGADLYELRALLDDPRALEMFMSRLGGVLDQLERGPWATVAVVEGFALAGGCELMLACDITIAATDAKIGDRHAELGLAPAAGGSVRLPRAIPRAVAHHLMLTGEVISGAQAAAKGLVSTAVPAGRLDREADRVIARLRDRGRDTLTTVKTMLDQTFEARAAQMRRELDLFLAHMSTSPDPRAGLDAFTAR
jgi:enoyl-CoA hydratase/carnithine racemase